MIDVSFDPNLTLGPVSTTWSSFLALVAVALGTVIWVRLTRAEWLERYGEGQGDAHLYAVAAASIAAGPVRSRLFHVVDFWPVYAGDLVRILDISTGRAAMGAIRRCGRRADLLNGAALVVLAQWFAIAFVIVGAAGLVRSRGGSRRVRPGT